MAEQETAFSEEPIEPEKLKLVDSAEQSEQRIQDLETASFACDDPLMSNVGLFNAQLLRIGKRLGDALADAWALPPDSLVELDGFLPGMNSYLRFGTLIERFAKLQLKQKKQS